MSREERDVLLARLDVYGRSVVRSRTTRDRAIRRAFESGVGVREIGRAVGLTHRAVGKIVGTVTDKPADPELEKIEDPADVAPPRVWHQPRIHRDGDRAYRVCRVCGMRFGAGELNAGECPG